VAVADEVAVRGRWLREDIPAVAGPDHASRGALYDGVVAASRVREEPCPHRLRPVRTLWENQRQAVLALAAGLDQELAALAREFAVPLATVRAVLQTPAWPATRPPRWQQEGVFWRALGERDRPLREAVAAVAAAVVRASRVIENRNSRLRSYVFLRRQLGPDYLALLPFFLKHRRFVHSEQPDRVGKSPAALWTGEAHPHWLELLGYQQFSRN
jgi:hypothetical protein